MIFYSNYEFKSTYWQPGGHFILSPVFASLLYHTQFACATGREKPKKLLQSSSIFGIIVQQTIERGEIIMANMKQQIKRYKNDNEKNAANTAVKSALKTSIKKVLKAVEEGNKEVAVKEFSDCTRQLDSSVSKHIHHKNYANRQKARLQKKINSIG